MEKKHPGIIEVQGWKFYPGQDDGAIVEHPLFFYHLPKCGGMSFDYAVQTALKFAAHATGGKGFSGRCDFNLTGQAAEKIREYGNPEADRKFIYAVTHDPFGVHETFKQNFNLITVVRDPIKRVASAYGYHCMRQSKLPTEKDFEAFIIAPENNNMMVRQLSGDGDQLNSESAAKALDNLATKFTAYCTLKDMDRLILWALKTYHAPNVMLTPSNATLPAYRVAPEPFADLIQAHNPQDILLYQGVLQTPRLPNLPPNTSNSAQTIVHKEEQNEEGSYSNAAIIPTEKVMALLTSTTV